jgi:SAM-dependent methyltransferase
MMLTAHSHRMRSNPTVVSIVSNTLWLQALTSWASLGGCPCSLRSAPPSLPAESWQLLQAQLMRTGWFEVIGEAIAPNLIGRDCVARGSELFNAMRRENKQDRRIVELLDTLPRGAAVDIGCGPDHSSLRFAKLGYEPVYAYDSSATGIEIAKAVLNCEGRPAHLYAEDATPLAEIGPNALALVYSRSSLHYLKQKELARTLNRTLRPGGHLVAEVVGLHYYLQRKHVRNLILGRWKKLFSYVRTVLRTLVFEVSDLQPRLAGGAPEIGYTKHSICRLARRAGLEVVSMSSAPSSVGFLVVMRKPI